MADPAAADLKTTPLHALHVSLGAKMVPFAGYSMPVQYPLGVLKEHLHTRAQAGLFDVSHMGQADLTGDDVAAALEELIPGDLKALAAGRIRYSTLLTEAGGIIDDLMVTRPAEPGSEKRLFLVVNAACKEGDFDHIVRRLGSRVQLKRHEDRALLALQGPAAAGVLTRFVPACAAMPFMSSRVDSFALPGGAKIEVRLFRSGYTGEDGYEISIPADKAEAVAKALLAQAEVQPIGLGARDSLRLEAGLCLYGSDIDINTTPIEANLSWIISKRRKLEGGFPGAGKIIEQINTGTERLRVGIKPLGRAPARAHTEILDELGDNIGEITSGGFGPSVNGPVAMGYVKTAFASPGTQVQLVVRGQAMPAEVVALPFAPHRYFKTKP
ncbi:MAG: glycine cleavage system aminomethyltransferase GcvT [Rhodospirillaceae bacterium]|nr:glycine cleavage system aminomethyltransferase GcvT [Rhodospirillaceae bacterium]